MFSKFQLTNKGVELLNRVIAESKTLKFTKFQIGKGDFSGDKKTLTQLVSKIDEFNVSQTNVLADGITNIKGFYDNRNLSVASKLTEIGIMAQLGDDSLTEVLFSYANQPTDEAETIPSKESYFSRTFSVMNRTDNVTSITFDLKIKQDKYNFGTLEEMKAADYLDVGDKVTLWGNAALGDSSFKMYIITNQAQSIQLNNNLYAKEYFKIVNDLTTVGTDKALSAEMGKKLNDDKVNKNGDSFTGDVEFGNRNKIHSSDTYGTPVFMLDKAGNNHFGIGATGSENQTIRYGACNKTNNTWLEIDNSYKHKFDGNIYINGQYKVLSENDYITVGNNSDNNIYLYTEDVNSLRKAGFYYVSGGATNKPFDTTGALIHLPWVSGGGLGVAAKQLFVPDNANYIGVRTETNQDGNWKKISTDDNRYIYSSSKDNNTNTNYTFSKGNPVQRISNVEYKTLVKGTYLIMATVEVSDGAIFIQKNGSNIFETDGDLYQVITPQVAVQLNVGDIIKFAGALYVPDVRMSVTFIKVGE